MQQYQVLIAVMVYAMFTMQTSRSELALLAPCVAQNWIPCGLGIGKAVYQKYSSWSNIDTRAAFGTQCQTQFKGGFYRWKWTWSGKFWCPSISSTIKGNIGQRFSTANSPK
ncbi:unnamed protein product [Didymodactylos carnosus]|uniref:Uncharacterized protein n=1 Tax=Didymodactylos carnosus TaxID=1234261 RepID=A0A816C2J6_9BILA|nr:unnamed protein product [Didymodactylos carnosus]CAF1616020.1 unnamed protein product [Didymodactylos carnosus]CAF4340326.1 unnamed protein product [Didymodactylos carnosus]CAF4502787.1 unnamed protein product [Didymodactylos carnosus]